MKIRRYALLAVSVILLAVNLISCEAPLSDIRDFDFNFECEIVKGEPLPGERIEVRVTLINSDTRDFIYEGKESDFLPRVDLYTTLASGKRYQIFADTAATADDAPARHTVKSGESRSTVLYFTIPSDAPNSLYNAELSYGNRFKVFEKLFTISEE